jgi:hypothetical protein
MCQITPFVWLAVGGVFATLCLGKGQYRSPLGLRLYSYCALHVLRLHLQAALDLARIVACSVRIQSWRLKLATQAAGAVLLPVRNPCRLLAFAYVRWIRHGLIS